MGVEDWKSYPPSLCQPQFPERYDMLQYDALLHHEMALLPIKYKVLLFASHQDLREMVQTLLK